METYDQKIRHELISWQGQMLRRPGYLNKLSKTLQDKVNSWIPEKIHQGITVTIKQMIRGVLFGAEWSTSIKRPFSDLRQTDQAVENKIKQYKNAAAIEGAITGAGGILMGLADFPLLLAVKLKLLFEIASFYGYDTDNYKERIYLLHIFQLAFSSAKHRREVFLQMQNWEFTSRQLPSDINQFDWRSFQQEYRDYIDLAKLAQLIPVIGAPVGAVVNYRLIRKLGFTAIKAYHMRYFDNQSEKQVPYNNG